MEVKEYISKIQEGGFCYHNSVLSVVDGEQGLPPRIPRILAKFSDGYTTYVSLEQIVLRPEAWRALGKIEGWEEINHGFTLSSHSSPRTRYNAGAGKWHYKMLEFVNYLADGDTIDTALAKTLDLKV